MINNLKIVNDYKTLAIPLDMVASMNKVSTGYCLNLLHKAMVTIPESIRESKTILKELE